MQFFTILLVNIFTGAVIYLLLSLKLARSSAEYREQRMRREMDEIIKEFNSTANRNISILENKIATINRLMRESGSIQGVDITVTNDELIDNHSGQVEKKASENSSSPVPETKSSVNRSTPAIGASAFKKSLPEFFLHGISAIRSKVNEIVGSTGDNSIEENVVDDKNAQSVTVENNPDPYEKLIEKDLSSLNINGIIEGEAESREIEKNGVAGEVKESEILDILSAGNDRFATVAELDGLGCSIEMIAKYCNMPAGEIRLILNLQK